MGPQMNQRVVSKSGAKRATQVDHSKSISTKTGQKKAEIKSRHNRQPASMDLEGQSKPNSIFSYKSADDKDVLAIIDVIRTGISFNEFEKIVGKAPFSLAEWANYLQLSER